MKEQIESYQPKRASVVAIGDRRVRAFVGDQQARLGATLWIGNTPTRIVSLAGARRVEAIAFDTNAFAVGDPVRCTDEEAAWPTPRAGRTTLDDLSFEPGGATPVGQQSDARDTLSCGVEVIDTLLPLAGRGVTLILDSGGPDEAFDRLLRAAGGTVVCASARIVPDATHQVLGSSALALVVAAAWAEMLDDALLAIEAPPFDVDELLVNRVITSIIRVELRNGLEILAETLELGHSDTQIVMRSDGTIDLTHSSSRRRPSQPFADRFGRLAQVREHVQIFGEHDLEDDDLAMLADAESLEAGLIG